MSTITKDYVQRKAIVRKRTVFEYEVTEYMLSVIRRLSMGQRTNKIAEDEGVSVRTLEAQLQRLKDHYNCLTLTQLVAYFIREKLID